MDRTDQANRPGRGGGTGGVRWREAQDMGAAATVAGCRAGAAHSRPSAGVASSNLGKLGAAWLGLESLVEPVAFARTHTQRRQGCRPSKVLPRAAGMESPERMNPANMRDHATHWRRARWRPMLATRNPTHPMRAPCDNTRLGCSSAVERVKRTLASRVDALPFMRALPTNPRLLPGATGSHRDRSSAAMTPRVSPARSIHLSLGPELRESTATPLPPRARSLPLAEARRSPIRNELPSKKPRERRDGAG